MLDRIVMYLVQARYYLESSLAISMGFFGSFATDLDNQQIWIKKKNEDINKKYDNYIFIVVIHNSNFKNYRHLGNVL